MKKIINEDQFRANLIRLKELLDKFEFSEKSLSREQINKIFRYFEMMLERNRYMNLTAVTEAEDVSVKHVEDSFSVLPLLSNVNYFAKRKNDYGAGLQIMDLGTGAGLPGILLAIALPEAEFILADSLQKRIIFLSEVVEALKLKNVRLIHSRAEDFARTAEFRDNVQIIIARAIAAMPTLIEYALPLLKVGGILIAMKAKEDELAGAENAMKLLSAKELLTYNVKLSDDSKRTIYLLQKTKKTGRGFPRRNGTAKDSPL